MNQALVLSIVAAGFTVAFFHAALPTHWLPFVVTSRAQHWNKTKTLTITAFAGTGHIFITTLLGVLVVWLGMNVDRLTGSIFPLLGGGLLVLVGPLLYLSRRYRGGNVHLVPGRTDIIVTIIITHMITTHPISRRRWPMPGRRPRIARRLWGW